MHGLKTIHRLEAERAEAHRILRERAAQEKALLDEFEERERERLHALEREQRAQAVPLAELLAEEQEHLRQHHADIIGD